MGLNKYIPFLKLKVNEIGALKLLPNELKNIATPFFDLPRKKNGMTEPEFILLVQKSAKSISKNLMGIPEFFIDNFDIDNNITVNGVENYFYIIEKFQNLNFIPVVGLDRKHSRNESVFLGRQLGLIKSDRIALRLQSEDIEDFALVEDEIQELIERGEGVFTNWTVIIDNRVCLDIKISERITKIQSFLKSFHLKFIFDQVVITGSSIPASIGEVTATHNEGDHDRREMRICSAVFKYLNDERNIMGDYTIVSPLYSDIDIPPEAMRNITAPKIVYSYDGVHYILRGGRLSSHPRGNLQYNDLAAQLVSLPFYRKRHYSFGDEYLDDKANEVGPGVTPSSILKPTINAHIVYMYKDYHL